ncbi:unnamed protein product [Ilex paraguariensis]|uniref:RNase H type-1 domain-containing protein n=1 Tax=Ilex paraguariensis TaxID=185542 RepID=A0ABC8UGV1_9AQUA
MGAVFSSCGCSGVGVVLRNHEGHFLAGLSLKLVGQLSANNIEAWATFTAVRLGHELGFWRIVLEGASKVVTDAIQKTRSDFSEIGNFVEKIQAYGSSFESFSVSWIQRAR